jgi:hypothetical protein
VNRTFPNQEFSMISSLRFSSFVSLIQVALLATVLLAASGCASTSEISSLRSEVSALRGDVQLAREAAEAAAADANRASQDAQMAAQSAAEAKAQAALANEKAERVYVRSLAK